ncbi:hypothetical protein Alg215_07669 [Pyrenophora tritici-repentis]|nr:hypothetical protein Alg215_07669 [Pyrenophora tritici-repentis]
MTLARSIGCALLTCADPLAMNRRLYQCSASVATPHNTHGWASNVTCDQRQGTLWGTAVFVATDSRQWSHAG